MTKDKRRYINTTIWDKSWFRKLSPSAQLLYLYFLTTPLSTLSGIYEITEDRMEFDTNLKPKESIKELVKAGEIARVDDWVIIVRHPIFQKWESSPKIAIGLFNEISEMPENVFHALREVGYHYPAIYSTEAWQQECMRLGNNGMKKDGEIQLNPPYPFPKESKELPEEEMIPFVGAGMRG